MVLDEISEHVGQYKEFEGSTLNRVPTKNQPWLSRVFFFWFDFFILKGKEGTLKGSPLDGTMEPEDSATSVSSRWDLLHRFQTSAPKSGAMTFSLIIKLCKRELILSAILETLRLFFILVCPLILRKLIAYLEEPESESSIYKGIQLCLSLVLAGFIGSLCETHSYFQLNKAGILMKTALISAVYKKSLKILQPNDADVMNLISVDIANLQKGFRFAHFPWSCPIQIGVSIFCLFTILNNAVLPGIFVFGIILAVSFSLTVRMKRQQADQLSRKDSRLQRIIETIANLKIIKLQVWEETFQASVDQLRNNELSSVRIFLGLQAIQGFLWNCAVFIIAFASFSVYSVDKDLDPQTAFISLALLNNMRSSFRLIPSCVTAYTQGSASIQRIDDFLESVFNLVPSECPSNKKAKEDIVQENIILDNNEAALVLQGCSFSRQLGSGIQQISLENISLLIRKGEFVGLLGGMGSGKSTLISALNGELRKTSGGFQMTDKILMAPNSPWLRSGSIRDNIMLDGSNQAKQKAPRSGLYEKVLRCCGLVEDLQRLPEGDLTKVKKGGENLSGGQRQRIGLARAVYKNASIYLLDDPLSAIDPCLRQKIFEHVIGNNGMLRKKTRILVTNEQKFLEQTDYIIVMKNQEIFDIGTYDELLARHTIPDYLYQSDEDDVTHIPDETPKVDHSQAVGNGSTNPFKKHHIQDKDKIRRRSVHKYIREQQSIDDDIVLPYGESPIRYSKRPPILMRRTSSISAACPQTVKGSLSIENQYDQIDDISDDKVGLEVYIYYSNAFGLQTVFVAILLFCLYQGFEVGSKVWLSDWASLEKNDSDADPDEYSTADYITVYGLFGLFQSFAFLGAVLLVNERTLAASRTLHCGIFRKVLHSTIDFVWTTPLGQIANRFSKDTDEMDVVLPNTFKNFLNQFLRIIGSIIIINYTFPRIVISIIPLTLGSIYLLKTYLTTSRMLRRLSAATMAVVNGHFAETIMGVATIRDYNLQAKMTEDCMHAIDDHQKFFELEMVSDCWLFVRLQMIISMFIGTLSFTMILYRDSIGAHLAGLSLTSAITIMQDVFLCARYAAALEKAMISVERIREYECILQENHPPGLHCKATAKSNSNHENLNPRFGEVFFDHVTSKYPIRGDVTLRDITFVANPGQKIAIVGRTGSGKSSLVASLFRLMDLVDGFIFVDGEDVHKKNLCCHRNSITIIPQESALFGGTLRFNLDPPGKWSDQHIWTCIRDANLQDLVGKHESGLDTQIQPTGEGLSNGEKQAICCIRGLLADSRVVVLDESTSCLGPQMEDRMSAAFDLRFKMSTVFMITHNIEKTLKCDKIIVLECGLVKEFDSPYNLLNNRSTVYYEMAKESGLV